MHIYLCIYILWWLIFYIFQIDELKFWYKISMHIFKIFICLKFLSLSYKSIYLWGMIWKRILWYRILDELFYERNWNFSTRRNMLGGKEEIAGNRKIENTLFLVKLFIFGIIVKKTLLKISKVRLYYVKKKNLFPSILTKLFFFPVFTQNKLLMTNL